MASISTQTPEQQASNKKKLMALMKKNENKECFDCTARNPNWASTNLGVFVCIRCAGLHRQLGVHISKVKSCTMDLWHPEQVSYMGKMGNRIGKMYYEATMPAGYGKPTLEEDSDTVMKWLRVKYEQKKYWGKPSESQKTEIETETKPKMPKRVTRKAYNPQPQAVAATTTTTPAANGGTRKGGKAVHSCFDLTDHEAASAPAAPVAAPVEEAPVVIPESVSQPPQPQQQPPSAFAGLYQAPVGVSLPVHPSPQQDEQEISSEYEDDDDEEEEEEEDEESEEDASEEEVQPQTVPLGGRNKRSNSFVNLMSMPKPEAVEIPPMPEAPTCNSPTPVKTTEAFPSSKPPREETSFMTFNNSQTATVTTSGGDSFLAELTSSNGSPTTGNKCSILDAFNAPEVTSQAPTPIASGPPPLMGHGVPVLNGNGMNGAMHMDSNALQSQIQELQRLQKQLDQQIAMSQNPNLNPMNMHTSSGPPPIQFGGSHNVPPMHVPMTTRSPIPVSKPPAPAKDPFSDLVIS